jgi:hypothetical protein
MNCAAIVRNLWMASRPQWITALSYILANARRDVFEAMRLVDETHYGPAEQISSMGCSIKWRD